MKNYWKPLVAVVVVAMAQIILGILLAIPGMVKNVNEIVASGGDASVITSSISIEALALASVFSGIFTILILTWLKMVDWRQTFSLTPLRWGWSVGFILAALIGIFAMDLLEEILDLPNFLEAQFTGMSTTILGFLAIGIVGPVCEELIFREAILGSMLRDGVHPWRAVIISAVIFGIIHANPAQIPFAASVGLILGYIYYKTGNVVISSIIHIINNSFACLLIIIFGTEANDFSMVKGLGGLPVAIPIIIFASLLCAYLLRRCGKDSEL